jgi:peptidoglycan/LPS O-acetylase OafA/YrhL
MTVRSESDIPGPNPSERMPALDGLRGVAALMVLVSHCMLLIPTVSEAFGGTGKGGRGLAWVVTYTPLHAFWAGSEAVVVFFVLSGFVLTRAADRPRFSWRAYYPSRLLRLYLPVAGALVFAAITFDAVPRNHSAGLSSWLKAYQQITVGVRNVAHDLLLVRGANLVLPPLWSLKWEVIFSLLLPLAVFGASRRWPIGLAQTVVLLGVTILGADTAGRKGYLLYLPMFGIGAVMARHHHLLSRLGRRLTTTRGVLVVVLGVVTLTASWTAHDQSSAVYRPFEVIGAVLIVFAFGYWRPLRTAGESRPLQWLGKRSFSLYLVHYPIVLSTAILLGSLSRFAFVIAIPLSLFGAHLFFRFVEGPSHRLSQSVKAKLTRAELLTRAESIAASAAPPPGR